MKLRNIEYIDTNGKSGLPAISHMDKQAVTLYKTNRVKFERYLSIASKKIYGISRNISTPQISHNDDASAKTESDAHDYT